VLYGGHLCSLGEPQSSIVDLVLINKIEEG
jgi:hypothetical protein